jgi:hypothetical protein
LKCRFDSVPMLYGMIWTWLLIDLDLRNYIYYVPICAKFDYTVNAHQHFHAWMCTEQPAYKSDVYFVIIEHSTVYQTFFIKIYISLFTRLNLSKFASNSGIIYAQVKSIDCSQFIGLDGRLFLGEWRIPNMRAFLTLVENINSYTCTNI